ncbi:MAG: hypothetical protein ABI200_05650 [Gaiellales bacterium]
MQPISAATSFQPSHQMTSRAIRMPGTPAVPRAGAGGGAAGMRGAAWGAERGAKALGSKASRERAMLEDDLRRIAMAMMLGVVNVATIQRLQSMGYGHVVDRLVRSEVSQGRRVTSGMQADLAMLGINVPISLGELVNPSDGKQRHQRAGRAAREAVNGVAAGAPGSTRVQP